MMHNNVTDNSKSFRLFNNYYDLLYHDKDYALETRYVADLIKKYMPNASDILELGFGTGNYSKHLSYAGYTITGIEKSEQMFALAKKKSIPNFLPVLNDITTFTINKKFDAAISLFHVIGYLIENKEVMACFKKVSDHLKKDGYFIFDVWYSSAVYIQQPRRTVKNIDSGTSIITRIAIPTIIHEKNIVQIDYRLVIKNKQTQHEEILNETHFMRHFSTPEIKLIAELSGFRLIHSEEFLTSKPASPETWGVCYILQKND